jgi:hypothetical protein
MFDLDEDAARAADNKSVFIDEPGKYSGIFSRAEYMEKKETGSTGIGFTFKSNDGGEAQFYINLTYQHGTKNTGGYQIVNAIMVCLGLKQVGSPKAIDIEKWDKEAGQRVKVSVNGFPDFMDKSIGLLLQMEIEKNSATGIPRPVIFAIFDSATEKTASEILDKRLPEPVKLGKMLDQIMSKPVVDRRPKDSHVHQPMVNSQSAPPADWDEIPFD